MQHTVDVTYFILLIIELDRPLLTGEHVDIEDVTLFCEGRSFKLPVGVTRDKGDKLLHYPCSMLNNKLVKEGYERSGEYDSHEIQYNLTLDDLRSSALTAQIRVGGKHADNHAPWTVTQITLTPDHFHEVTLKPDIISIKS